MIYTWWASSQQSKPVSIPVNRARLLLVQRPVLTSGAVSGNVAPLTSASATPCMQPHHHRPRPPTHELVLTTPPPPPTPPIHFVVQSSCELCTVTNNNNNNNKLKETSDTASMRHMILCTRDGERGREWGTGGRGEGRGGGWGMGGGNTLISSPRRKTKQANCSRVLIVFSLSLSARLSSLPVTSDF